MNRSATRIAAVATATVALLGCATAAASASSAAPAPKPALAAATASTEAPAPAWGKRVTALVSGTDDHDGVKGKVKNMSTKSIRVMDAATQDYIDLAPGQDVTYYGSAVTSLKSGGEGKRLSITSLDPAHRFGANEHRIEVSDPDLGRPDSRYSFRCNWSDPHTVTDNIRRAWNEGDVHYEQARDRSISTDTKMMIKRESDGWNGGYESEDTADWQVFTIHVEVI